MRIVFRPARLDLSGGRGHLLLTPRRGNHIGARVGQTKAQRKADARRASGHNRDLAFKAELLRVHPISEGNF